MQAIYVGASALLEEYFYTVWNDFDRMQSATYREIKTVDLFMKAFCHVLQSKGQGRTLRYMSPIKSNKKEQYSKFVKYLFFACRHCLCYKL